MTNYIYRKVQISSDAETEAAKETGNVSGFSETEAENPAPQPSQQMTENAAFWETETAVS